jgi:hypothetical protein
MAGSCDHGNGPCGSIRDREFVMSSVTSCLSRQSYLLKFQSVFSTTCPMRNYFIHSRIIKNIGVL